jgi:hypothetical protein
VGKKAWGIYADKNSAKLYRFADFRVPIFSRLDAINITKGYNFAAWKGHVIVTHCQKSSNFLPEIVEEFLEVFGAVGARIGEKEVGNGSFCSAHIPRISHHSTSSQQAAQNTVLSNHLGYLLIFCRISNFDPTPWPFSSRYGLFLSAFKRDDACRITLLTTAIRALAHR